MTYKFLDLKFFRFDNFLRVVKSAMHFSKLPNNKIFTKK